MLKKIAAFALMLFLSGFIANFAGDNKTEIAPNKISAVAQNTAGLDEKAGLAAPARDEALNKEAIMAKAASLAVPFVENAGQFNSEVKYSADLFAGRFFLTGRELVYSLVKKSPRKNSRANELWRKAEPEKGMFDKGLAFKEFFVNDKGKAIEFKSKGMEQGVTKVSYFRGNDPSKWQSRLSSFNGVSLGEIYPGIEVKLKASNKNVEKVFYVSPGSDVAAIKIAVAGVKRLKVSEDGQLLFINSIADLSMRAPIAWQEINGQEHDVKVGYFLLGKKQYGFAISGDYDKKHALIIDPALDTLLASTYLGGTGEDYATALALDPAGNVYIAGYTNSLDFPTTVGAYDREINPEEYGDPPDWYHDYPYDVFVSKLNGNLTELLASTYLGGDEAETYEFFGSKDFDYAYSLTLDSAGNVYVTGTTRSKYFPTTPGAYDRTFRGSSYDVRHAFISKLDSNLTTLLASTLLGGSGSDEAHSLALDSLGNVYLTGGTNSADFPTTSGAYDQTYNGGTPYSSIGDAFVSRLDGNLTMLLASTFLGGSSLDRANSLALDNAGNVYVTGSTESEDFPTTPGAYDRTYNGKGYVYHSDAFISKLNSQLAILQASTYLGGSEGQSGDSLALDSVGKIYLTGWTASEDFPTTPGAYQRIFNGYRAHGKSEAFISKLDGYLTELLASTFLSGSYGRALALDGINNVYMTGLHIIDCGVDFENDMVIISKVDKNLTALLGGRIFGEGCSIWGDGTSLVLDDSGNVYFSGWTTATDFPTTPGAYDQTFNGARDTFITKLNGSSIGINVTSPNGGERWMAGTVHSVIWTTEGTVGNVSISYSFDNGISWRNVTVTGNDGSYAWTVPGTPSDQCLVRVSDAAYPVVSDMSDAVFSIVNSPPQVEIVSPTDNATVFGIVTVKANAIDDGGVVRVEFYVDGVLKGNTTASHSAAKQKIFSSGIPGDSIRVKKAFVDSPTPQPGAKGLDVTSQYTFAWNAMEASPGSHVLRVAAYDGAGAMGFDEVTVQVIQLKLDLQAERREVRAYSILRYYGQVGFTVDNPGVPVALYRIMRRQGSTDFALLRTIAPSELQNNQFQMQDKYIEKDSTYTYRVEAIDAAGQLVGRSAEKTI